MSWVRHLSNYSKNVMGKASLKLLSRVPTLLWLCLITYKNIPIFCPTSEFWKETTETDVGLDPHLKLNYLHVLRHSTRIGDFSFPVSLDTLLHHWIHCVKQASSPCKYSSLHVIFSSCLKAQIGTTKN